MAGTDIKPRRIEAATYAVDASLRDSATIQVRALRPGDKGRLLQHFAGLSAKSRYLRFFGHKRALTNEDLVRFTELDFDRHVGIAATFCKDGLERSIGVGRHIRKDAPGRAEIALAVLDQYQSEGIGPLLLRHLARIANESGIIQFEVEVRGDNAHGSRQGRLHYPLRFRCAHMPVDAPRAQRWEVSELNYQGFVGARVPRVLVIVIWIRGIAAVTTVMFPVMRRMDSNEGKVWLFEQVESNFRPQARIAWLIVGLTGLYMVAYLGAWERFVEPHYWWMDAMVGLWVVFGLMLFVVEPLIVGPRIRQNLAAEPHTVLARHRNPALGVAGTEHRGDRVVSGVYGFF